MVSKPEKAETSMNSVERGRWKLVISTSTTRKRKPGVMKMSVSPDEGLQRAGAARGAFEQAQAGRAHGNDAPALAPWLQRYALRPRR